MIYTWRKFKKNGQIFYVKNAQTTEACIYTVNQHGDFESYWDDYKEVYVKSVPCNLLDYILNIFKILEIIKY